MRWSWMKSMLYFEFWMCEMNKWEIPRLCERFANEFKTNHDGRNYTDTEMKITRTLCWWEMNNSCGVKCKRNNFWTEYFNIVVWNDRDMKKWCQLRLWKCIKMPTQQATLLSNACRTRAWKSEREIFCGTQNYMTRNWTYFNLGNKFRRTQLTTLNIPRTTPKNNIETRPSLDHEAKMICLNVLQNTNNKRHQKLHGRNAIRSCRLKTKTLSAKWKFWIDMRAKNYNIRIP